MTGKKVFLLPDKVITRVIRELMELQKGEEILNNPGSESLNYRVTMFGFAFELRFTVIPFDYKRCRVILDVEEINSSDEDDPQFWVDMIHSEFAVMDALLRIGSSHNVTRTDEISNEYSRPHSTMYKKVYLQPFDMLLGAIHDLAELQKGDIILNDSVRGLVHIRVTLYRTEYEFRFTVDGIFTDRYSVTIELDGAGDDITRLIDHEFALLDYILIDRAKIEIAEVEKFEKQLKAEINLREREEHDSS